MEKTEKVLEKPEENFQVGISIDTLPSYTLKELAIFQIQDEHIDEKIITKEEKTYICE